MNKNLKTMNNVSSIHDDKDTSLSNLKKFAGQIEILPERVTTGTVEDVTERMQSQTDRIARTIKEAANLIYAGLPDVKTGDVKIGLSLNMAMLVHADAEISAGDNGPIIETKASCLVSPIKINTTNPNFKK